MQFSIYGNEGGEGLYKAFGLDASLNGRTLSQHFWRMVEVYFSLGLENPLDILVSIGELSSDELSELSEDVREIKHENKLAEMGVINLKQAARVRSIREERKRLISNNVR